MKALCSGGARGLHRLLLQQRLMRHKLLDYCMVHDRNPAKRTLRIDLCSAQAQLRGDPNECFLIWGEAVLNFSPAARGRCPRMG